MSFVLQLEGYMAPFNPVFNALDQRIPGLSDMLGTDVTILGLPDALLNGLLGLGGPVSGHADNVVEFVFQVLLFQFRGSQCLRFAGDRDPEAGRAVALDHRGSTAESAAWAEWRYPPRLGLFPAFSVRFLTLCLPLQGDIFKIADDVRQVRTATRGVMADPNIQAVGEQAANAQISKAVHFSKGGFQFPILQQPSLIFKLMCALCALLGRN